MSLESVLKYLSSKRPKIINVTDEITIDNLDKYLTQAETNNDQFIYFLRTEKNKILFEKHNYYQKNLYYVLCDEQYLILSTNFPFDDRLMRMLDKLMVHTTYVCKICSMKLKNYHTCIDCTNTMCYNCLSKCMIEQYNINGFECEIKCPFCNVIMKHNPLQILHEPIKISIDNEFKDDITQKIDILTKIEQLKKRKSRLSRKETPDIQEQMAKLDAEISQLETGIYK